MQNDQKYLKFDHNEYAKTRDPDDYWGQIRRTVNGKPVSEEQIRMIIDSIQKALAPAPDDVLLDLACGNGALSHRLFDSYAEYLGVDFSEHLIDVARKNFEVLPSHRFLLHDAAEYLRSAPNPERFTKVLCYGSFSYFPAASASDALRFLHDRFINVRRIFIGNLPDRDRATEFYKDRMASAEELLDHRSQIGIWRNRAEFDLLARDAGWKTDFSIMPADYYASAYRYDVLLSR